MADILFKRGLQSALPQKAQDGVFYLTTDSNRLYVGQGETMALLNQTVQIVSAVSALPTNANTNDFYYCTAENVLAVYNGVQWVQINPDTTNKTATVSATVGGSKDAVTLTTEFKVTDSKDKEIGAFDVTTFEGGRGIDITAGEDKIIVASNVDFDLGVSGATNKASVALTGSGDSVDADAGKFDIVGAGIATVSVEGSTITVSVADTNVDTYVESGEITGSVTDEKLTVGAKLVRNNDTEIVITSKEFDLSSFATDAKVDQMKTDLQTELNNRLNGLDAMTYKGTLADGAALPTEDVKAGDTYLALGVIAGVNGSKKGDLVIARGDEENGVLTNPQWDLVPAGDDAEIDTTYSILADAANKKVSLKGSDDSTAVILSMANGTAINVSVAADGAGLKYTIDHANVDHTTGTDEAEAPGYSGTFNVISGVEVNDQGHVTKVNTKEIAMPAAQEIPVYELDSANGVTVANNEAVYKSTLTLTGSLGDTETADVEFKLASTSENIEIAQGTGVANINFVWGTF